MLISTNHGALGWDRQCAHSRHVTVWWISGAPAYHWWSLGSSMWPSRSLLLALLPSLVLNLTESQGP